MSSVGNAHSSVARLYTDAIRSHRFTFVCAPLIYPILSASLSKISGEKINTKAPATQSPSVTRPAAAETEPLHQVCAFASTIWLMRKYTTV
jgi:hypothetical protein